MSGKKNTIKKITGTAVLLAVLSMTGCGSSEQPAAEEEKIENQEVEEETYSYQESHMEYDKEEQVYALADAYGNPTEITVTTNLKCPGETETITDYTTLTDIKNKEGDEEYTLEADGTLTWENHGADIQYEGTANKELPVNVQVTYLLNDKEVTPEELAGATGKVTIRFAYENRTGEGKDRVPFVVVSGMQLSADVASNVEATNARVKYSDDEYYIIGMTFPGMQQVFDTEEKEEDEKENDKDDEKDEIPETMEVTFDAKNFELDFTATIISNGLVEDLDTEKLDDKITKYVDNFGKLDEGVAKLADGMQKLAQSGDSLVAGAQNLQAGLESLNETMAALAASGDPTYVQLAAATQALTQGSTQMTAGVKQYTDGVKQAYDGTEKLKEGTGKLNDVADDMEELVDKIKNLKDADATYDNYAGIEEGKSGQVMFIVETAEIKE